MAILTERGQWANATVTERGRRVFANGLDERGQKVFGLSAGGATNVSITAVAAAATNSATAPTVTTSTVTNVSITAVAASVTSQSYAPTVSSDSSISSVSATANNTAYAPTISNAANASITGVAATVSAAGVAPSVTTQKQVAVSSFVANSTATANAPSVSAAQPNVSVSAVVASNTLAANAPSVRADANIAAAVTNAALSAGVPAFSTARVTTIAATVAVAVNNAIAPVVTTVRNVNVVQAVATAVAAVLSPKISLNALQIIGSVELKASRTLTVPLIGSRQLIVELKGGLPVAEVNQNFNMYAGESKTIPVTATNTEDGTPIPLDGAASIKWGLRRLYGTSNDVSKDTTAGITVTDAINGKFTINLDANDTRNLSGDFLHEARVIDSLGKESLVMKGIINIEATII